MSALGIPLSARAIVTYLLALNSTRLHRIAPTDRSPAQNYTFVVAAQSLHHKSAFNVPNHERYDTTKGHTLLSI